MLAAWPTQMVETEGGCQLSVPVTEMRGGAVSRGLPSDCMYVMQSYIANPAVTLPPGELM
jgi:hypothetical protein